MASTNDRPRYSKNGERPIPQPPVSLRIPPQNIDAEISCLGALLLDQEAYIKIADIVMSEDFYRPEHAMIFAAMNVLFEKRAPIDLVTVADELARVKKLDEAGGPAKLSSLVSAVSTAANVAHYATIVREKAMLRRLIHAAGEIGEIAFEEDRTTPDVLDTSERTLFAVTQRFLKQNFVSVRSILDDSFERLGMLAGHDGSHLRGIPSGFKNLDRILGGLQRSDLLILAARPAMGKCISGASRVLDPRTGELRTVEDMVRSDQGEAVTLTDDWKLAGTTPSRFIYDGVRPTFKLKTALGREIEATAVHPLLTVSGWKPLMGLAVGDRIATPKRLSYFGSVHWPEHLVKSLAYFISDGNVTHTMPRFTNVNAEIVQDFIRAVRGFGGVLVRVERSKDRALTLSTSVDATVFRKARAEWAMRFAMFQSENRAAVRAAIASLGLSPANATIWKQGVAQPTPATYGALRAHIPTLPEPTHYGVNPVRAFLEEQGIWGLSAKDKHIPGAVFTLQKINIALFLNRLYSCDGTACVSLCGGREVPCISYATVSKRLAVDVQHLLLRFGILAKLREKQVKYRGTRRASYEVEIHASEDLIRFTDEIGIHGKSVAVAKVRACAAAHKAGLTKDTLPLEVWDRLDAARAGRPWSAVYNEWGMPAGSNMHVHRREPRRETVRKIAQTFGDIELVQLADADIYWDRIVSIEPMGEQPVYDLVVPETHNFVANDIIVHNTAFALNIAEHVAVHEKRTVGIFSLEMGKEQLVDRLISSIGRVDAWKLRNGNLNEDDMSRLIEAQAQLAEANLFIDDGGMATVMEVRAKARRLQMEHGLDLLVIDYLQLMNGSTKNSENRVQEVSEISRGLKALAKELNCPIIALSQLSRAVESRPDKRPMLSDLRESGSIEQDADAVLFLYRDDYYNKNRDEHDNMLEVIISKHRHGATGEAKLAAQLQYSRFYDIDLHQQ
jgi:replicative DNA helicase